MRGRELRLQLRDTFDMRRPTRFWRAASVILMLGQLLMVDEAMVEPVMAQVSNPSIIPVASTPSSCATLPLKIISNSSNLYGTNGSGGCQLIGGGGGGDTITSPNSTISIGGTSSATTLDVNPALSATWTGAQTFNQAAGNLQFTNGFTLGSGVGSQIVPTSSSINVVPGGVTVAQFWNGNAIIVNSTAKYTWSSFGIGTSIDTGISRASAGVVQLNNGTAGSGGALQIPALKATTGTRYVCIDTSGNLGSSATACSGT